MGLDTSQTTPSIDVVLLSWNRTEMTIETIENLLEQKGVDLKIWIVDQGSKPENLKLLREATEEYSNVYIKALEKNVGVPGGRNIGMEMGSAEYTVSIDNDAVFESPYALAQVAQIFDQEPDVGVIGFRIMNFYTGQDDEYSWAYPKALKQIRDQRFTTTRFCGCGHAIRRSLFNRVGQYDADLFFYWEETDFSFRVINLGYRLIYEPSIVVRHKVSPEARVRWEDKRFYYLVRNSIYMRLKYANTPIAVIIPALGYLVKGLYNSLPLQTVKGIFEGVLMHWRLRAQRAEEMLQLCQLTPEAQDYLREHDLRYRGNFFNRIKTEILVNLPGDSRLGNLVKSKTS